MLSKADPSKHFESIEYLTIFPCGNCASLIFLACPGGIPCPFKTGDVNDGDTSFIALISPPTVPMGALSIDTSMQV